MAPQMRVFLFLGSLDGIFFAVTKTVALEFSSFFAAYFLRKNSKIIELN